MKRIGTLLLAASLIATGLGCKNKSTWTGELPANATTGYTWVQCEETGEDASCVFVALDYVAGKSAQGYVGVPGKATVAVTGVSPGEASVTLCYVQTWDWDGKVDSADAVANYRFVVGDDLRVALLGQNVTLPPSMQE